jgi:threonine/homoserine/homoserine lactone efflux protein
MPLETYLAYLFTLGVFFATPPGPSQLLMISNSARHGLKPSLFTACGDLSANALQMTAAAFGLAGALALSGDLLIALKWAGVAYLVYIGIRTFRAGGRAAHGVAAAVSRRHLYRQGFLTSAANPKAVFFFAALFPQFIDPALAVWPQLLILGATYIAVDGFLLVLWGSAAERALRALAARPGWLNRVSGGLMIVAAGLLALKDADGFARR